MGEPAFVACAASCGLRYFGGIAVGMGIAREGFEKGKEGRFASVNLGQKPCHPAAAGVHCSIELGTILDANVV